MTRVIPLTIARHAYRFAAPLTIALIQGEGAVILSDCGYPGDWPAIVQALSEQGLRPADVTHVILTHHDGDHMGALYELKQENPRVQVLCSKEQAPYVAGERPPVRLTDMLSRYVDMPLSERPTALSRLSMYKAARPVPVDATVQGGDRVGPVQIVDTPGHLPGHLSLYVPDCKVLIAGDAMNVIDGKLSGANPRFTLDMDEANRSIQSLKAYPIERVICSHGGVYEGGIDL